MGRFGISGSGSPFWFVLLLGFAFIVGPGEGWSKEGHMMTCRIAQVILVFPFSGDLGFCFYAPLLLVTKKKKD